MSTELLMASDKPISPLKQKQLDKKQLKKLQGQPYHLGKNYLNIVKVSDKHVIMSEMFNGLKQEHQRYSIGEALEYFKYRKNQFQNWPTKAKTINLSEQNNQYQQQHRNIVEMQAELENHIHAITKYRDLPKLAYRIQFTDNVIKIMTDQGFHVSIALKPFDHTGSKIEMKYSFHQNDCLITNKDDWFHHHLLGKLCELVHSSTREAVDFISVFETYVICNRQLDKLYTEPHQISDSTLLEDLHNFIEKGQATDIYSYALASFDGWSRWLEVEKISRVRTIASIVTSKDDHTFWEFRKVYSKISHQIESNAADIAKIAQAHTY